jgi:hypothetical protein
LLFLVPSRLDTRIRLGGENMNSLIYLIGLIVVAAFILSFLGVV